MKRWLTITAVALALLTTGATAAQSHADVIWCGYPATGYYARADVAIVVGVLYACDFPREINGAHRHQEALILDASFNTGANVAGMGGSNSLSAGLAIGGQAWSSSCGGAPTSDTSPSSPTGRRRRSARRSRRRAQRSRCRRR